jgi:WhiB family redox-sensing transcriptional regulator
MSAAADWRHLAACRDVDTATHDPFFAPGEAAEHDALNICRLCPVQAECLAYAMDTGPEHGIWGGTRQRDLRRLIVADRRGRTRTAGHPARHFNARKTQCKYGHPFDEPNTYYAPDGQRRCRTCLRNARQVWAQRRRLQRQKTRRVRRPRKAGERDA